MGLVPVAEEEGAVGVDALDDSVQLLRDSRAPDPHAGAPHSE